MLNNNVDAVVKYPRNRFGTVVLVREWIGSCIAKLLGVSVPDFGVCYLSESVILESDFADPDFGYLTADNAGYSYYSVLLPSGVPIQREWLRKHNTHDLAIIVIYDYVLNNCDRHEGNILQLINDSNRVVCIDNSHIITDKNDNSPNFSEYLTDNKINDIIFYHKDKELYNLFLKDISDTELAQLGNQAIIKLSDDKLQEIKDTIPTEWQLQVGKETIDGLINVIGKRVKAIPVALKKIKEVQNG